jgi:hypothetical protein
MPQFAARADANQPEIVECLRALGYKVAHTHTLGRGLPDIIVAGYHYGDRRRALLWVEIKSPRGRLTGDEKTFFAEWSGEPVIIARSVTDVLEWFEDERIKATEAS